MIPSLKRYSSRVTICLVIAGIESDVARVADNELYVRNPTDVQPGDGILTIKIDERERSEPVMLPYGIRGSSKKVRYF